MLGEIVYLIFLTGSRSEGKIGGPTAIYKIGTTSDNPEARRRQLQTGCPAKLEIINSWRGGKELESEMHEWLKAERIGGEWFEVPDFIGLHTMSEEELRMTLDYAKSQEWTSKKAAMELEDQRHAIAMARLGSQVFQGVLQGQLRLV